MTRSVDVLAIAAHPDDAEIGCGATLILAAGAGFRVVVADLSDGELATAGTPDRRDAERAVAAKVLGLAERRRAGLPDGRLGADLAHRDTLVALIRELRPRIMLAPSAEDRHPDHAAAGRLARDACFFAGVAKAGPGAPHRPARLYHYMLHHPFPPSFVVDVTSTWQRSRDALAAYQSQFTTSASELGAGFLAYLDARAVHYGAMIGVARGEPFLAAGPLPAAALPGLQEQDDPTAYRVFR